MIEDPLSPYVLASLSPRRRELLKGLGLEFEIIDPGLEEVISPDVSPEVMARQLAEQKAWAAARNVEGGTLIAGDTIVALGPKILGKPRDKEHATSMLRRLSGARHRVISSLALLHRHSGLLVSGVDVAHVTMREWAESEIADYVASGECFGKAGGYAIQETADRFVTKLEGEFDTVVGFPTLLFEPLRAKLRDQVRQTSRG